MQRNTFDVPCQEWESAKRHLAPMEDGSKILYSHRQKSDGSYKIRNRFKHNPPPYITTHSFIKIKGKIYAIAQGKDKTAIIGEGAFGVAKYAKDESGNLAVLKVIPYQSGDAYSKDQLSTEYTILSDIGLSLGGAIIKDNEDRQTKWMDRNGIKHEVDKGYILIKHLGKTLKSVLKQNALNNESALDLGIQLCWKVHCLHAGLNSRSHRGYAHMDLKPSNVTVDEDNKIHLIDFGLAETNPDDVLQDYYPQLNAYKPINYDVVSKKTSDIFALKRILYLPLLIVLNGDYVSTAGLYRLFDDDFINQHQLFEYFSTVSNKSYRDDTASQLCALLIAAKYNMHYMYQDIVNDTDHAESICKLYFSSPERFKKFKPFFKLQNQLLDKEKQFSARGEYGAEQSCRELNNHIKNEIRDLSTCENMITGLEDFKENCHRHVEQSRRVLETHSGILGFLDAFLTCLTSLVIAYPLTELVIKPALNSHCLFFRTNSAKKLDQLDNAISGLGADALC